MTAHHCQRPRHRIAPILRCIASERAQLASNLARFFTGAVLMMDGGFTAR
jgi:hypothetical protein